MGGNLRRGNHRRLLQWLRRIHPRLARTLILESLERHAVSVISFGLTPRNRPSYQVTDKRYDLLGEWLTTDLSRFFVVVLDALAMADDVAEGRPPFEEWTSEN